MRDIKKVGDYVALVHFHKEVTTEIPVKVVAENAPVEEAPAAVIEEQVEAPVQEEAAAEE
jgi:large subunit ribosomal protein L9